MVRYDLDEYGSHPHPDGGFVMYEEAMDAIVELEEKYRELEKSYRRLKRAI